MNILLSGYSIVSPLGLNVNETFEAMKKGESNLKEFTAPYLSHPVFVSMFDKEQKEKIASGCPGKDWTLFEQILYLAGKDAIDKAKTTINPENTIFIFSTTKGNIGQIEQTKNPDGLLLSTSSQKVAEALGGKKYMIISSACISGLSAIITGARLLSQHPELKQAVILGADTINEFVLSGFHSLMALSSKPCRSFDASRDGINLGEAAAGIVLQKNETNTSGIYYRGGAVTNDANHISGPSRTGEELAMAIKTAMQKSGLSANRIDFVSAHGTATLYNDEMESKALSIAGLSEIPTHSLKAYFGHTLGAAGVIESIVCVRMLCEDVLLPSLHFEKLGVSCPLNIQIRKENKILKSGIKTMAGFGGFNAAICFEKKS